MRRPVPTLTAAQEAFLSGIDNERFSLKKAVKMYLIKVMPGATWAVAHTYKNDAAYDTEVLRSDGTVAANTMPAAALQLKQAQI